MPGQPMLFNNNLTAGNSHQAAGNPFLELSGTPGLAKPTQPKLMHPLPQNVAQVRCSVNLIDIRSYHII